MNKKEILHKRLDKYEAEVKKRIDDEHRRIDKGLCAGDQEDNIWLEKHAKGVGLDICSGHIPLGGAIGVDLKLWNKDKNCGSLGPLSFTRTSGDELSSVVEEELDFVISNYIETLPSPLKAFIEWERVLKSGGVLALTVSNADKYIEYLGPFKNGKRANIFTPTTIKFYLRRVGLIDIKITDGSNPKMMRVFARKFYA